MRTSAFFTLQNRLPFSVLSLHTPVQRADFILHPRRRFPDAFDKNK